MNADAIMTKENLIKAASESTNSVLDSTQESDKKSKRNPEKFVLYYPLSGTPFYSFNPKLEIASIVKK